MHSEENRSTLTSKEVEEFFRDLSRKLHAGARSSFPTIDDARRYTDAISTFNTHYDKLLQDFYESVEFIESMAENKGTNLESEATESYIYVWHFLKELPLIKQRWRRRKR